MDENARRYWINTYRQWARLARNSMEKLDVPLNDPLATQVERRLRTLLEFYDAAIAELESGFQPTS